MTSVPALRGPAAAPALSIKLTDDWAKQSMARAVSGATWNRDQKAWIVEDPDARTAAVICRLFPQLQDVYPELQALRDTLYLDSRPFDNATPFAKWVDARRVEGVLKGLPCIACGGTGKRWTGNEACRSCNGLKRGGLLPYQGIDLGYITAVLKTHFAGEIAWERGMGKTVAAACLMDALAADRILVVAPNTAKQDTWERELNRLCPWLETFVLPNQKDKRVKMIDKLQHYRAPLVLIAHYEALDIVAQTRSARKGWRRLGEWDFVVADESHRLANTMNKMHRAIMQVPAAMKLSMTGSMIMNHPEEIFGRARWLFPKQYKSKWLDWNNRYLDYVESDYGKVLIGPRADMLDEMRAELGVWCVYRRKRDELDLPPKKESTVRVELSPEQRAAYDSLVDTCVATLDSGEQVFALQPVVLLTRLRQVATGLSLVSGSATDSSKLDAAMGEIDRHPGEPFVTFSWYRGAAEALAERLGDDAVLVTGDTPHAQRTKRIREFRDGKGRVFVGTISTLGESVNLQRASRVQFLDRSWNPAQNEQAVDRCDRLGQTQSVQVTYFVAEDTVDEYNVLPVLNNKETLRRMILGGV
jgi:SNF2 family DNA or RNA helicase